MPGTTTCHRSSILAPTPLGDTVEGGTSFLSALLTHRPGDGNVENAVIVAVGVASVALPLAGRYSVLSRSRSALRSSDTIAQGSSQNAGTSGGTRAGKPFTRKGRAEIDAENARRNGGVNICESCRVDVAPGQRSQKGVTPPGNERQRDHIIPKSKGGDGDPSNGQVLCRACNLEKSDN